MQANNEIISDQKKSPPRKILRPEKVERLHNVGQMDHNIHKIRRILEKGNYPAPVDTKE
jgi:hypothetical protein